MEYDRPDIYEETLRLCTGRTFKRSNIQHINEPSINRCRMSNIREIVAVDDSAGNSSSLLDGRVILIKLGGSLVSDKTKKETLRKHDLARIASEIRDAIAESPSGTRIVVGHGSGSFGHIPAAEHGTIDGVSGPAQWRGFCEVSDAALRLNRLVTAALLEVGVPAISLQPAASALCRGGTLVSLATGPIKAALKVGLVPVVHGDVAFDEELGGTIASTETIFSFLAHEMASRWLLLAGEAEGVYDEDGTVVPEITSSNLETIVGSLGGSRGTDVTGGMASKVRGMLSLVESLPDTRIRIFSGLEPGSVKRALLLAARERDDEKTAEIIGRNGCPDGKLGTIISAATAAVKPL